MSSSDAVKSHLRERWPGYVVGYVLALTIVGVAFWQMAESWTEMIFPMLLIATTTALASSFFVLLAVRVRQGSE